MAYTATAKEISELRKATDAGLLECKKALEESNGNQEKAVEWLRKNSAVKAEKKATRIAAAGTVFNYVHLGGKIAVIVEVNCETDFAAKNEKFQELGKGIAMHIAATNPTYVRSSEVPAEIVAKEKEILMAQIGNKPAAVLEKIAEGKIAKFYEENCLENMLYVKDDSKTIMQLVQEATATIGEKITIRRFARFEVGEGIAKKEENFAEEVAKMTGK
ncbi:MAG: translation elongation factor Ts [Firmicutes bacterium]|nr:translation elongation factor Ts [Bacillota bacterium]MCL2770917.1 translation elongation factor Ts [Bacillota bacterium]